MYGRSYKIAKVWGIPIKVHISLIIVLAAIALTVLKAEFGAAGVTALGKFLSVAFILFFLVLIFASIAMHELGHSFVALRKGCRVREIILMAIGGAAQMERIPSKPKDEFQMAIAGPIVSLAIGTACFLAAKYLNDRGHSITSNYIFLLGRCNVFLALFNLLPAFPMDGGRILRSMLSRRFGRLRATFIASRIGRAMAILFGVYAVYGIRYNPGLWVLFCVAPFIFTAAGNEYRIVQLQEAAKRAGFESWAHEERVNDDNRVIIGPPPYGEGRGSETEIRTEVKRNFFDFWR